MKRKNWLTLLALPLFSILLSAPLNSYAAETEPQAPAMVDISESDKLSATGISEYDLTTQTETGEAVLSDIPENPGETSESFVPGNIPLERIPRKVIGTDERTRVTNTTAFPNSAIGQIWITFPNNKTYIGTAWMYGEKVAVTAGHCVYSKNDGGWAKAITFYPGKNGTSNPLGSYSVTKIQADTNYIQTGSSNYDWGLIGFGTNVSSKTGYFGAEAPTGNLTNISVIVRGYPGEKSSQMWTSSGKITGSGTSKINYSIDTTGGQSGSPVYRSVSGQYRSLGIHTNYSSAGYNQGQKIDASLLKIMNNARSW